MSIKLKCMRVWDKSLYEIFKDNSEIFDSFAITNNNFQGIAKDMTHKISKLQNQSKIRQGAFQERLFQRPG